MKRLQDYYTTARVLGMIKFLMTRDSGRFSFKGYREREIDLTKAHNRNRWLNGDAPAKVIIRNLSTGAPIIAYNKIPYSDVWEIA
jgi:hypothetical protein